MCISAKKESDKRMMEIEANSSDGDRYDDAHESGSDSSQENIELHDNDVLSGRGKGVGSHPGNLYFREVIRKYKQTYADSPRSQKMAVANEVIDEMENQNPPGRFLERLSDGTYVKLSFRRILEKTSQALREKSSGYSPSQGPLSSSATANEAIVDADGLLQHAIIDTIQQEAQRLQPYYENRIVPTFLTPGSPGVGQGARTYASYLPQPQASNLPAMSIESSLHADRDETNQRGSSSSYSDDRNRFAGVASSYDDVTMSDQFSDAVEDDFNTSLAIFHYCLRSGYLGR